MEKIKVQSLSAQISGKEILQELDFQVGAGESLLIIGESGSGKTLLSKILVGQLPPALSLQGQVYYDDKQLQLDRLADWQGLRGRKIAYMSQNPMAMFNPFQKIKLHFWETLRSHESISKKACLAKAAALLRDVRLGHPEEILEKYPFELSGGMLQRIMLAIVLALDPELLILDEPTSALDAYNRDHILLILKDLLAQGKTLITVTHDYQLARELGGQVLVIYQGRILEQGPIDRLLTDPQEAYSRDLILGNPYERLVTNDARM